MRAPVELHPDTVAFVTLRPEGEKSIQKLVERGVRAQLQLEKRATLLNLRAEIGEGLAWLWQQPLIRYMAFLTGGLNFVNAGSLLMFIILSKNLGASPFQIGLISTIGGVGGIVGSLIGGRIQRRFSFGQVITATLWISALLFPLYAIAPHFYWLGVVSALLYVNGPVYNVVQFSYRIALIPDQLQGRVNSAFRLLAFGFQPIGAALACALIESIFAVPTVLVYSAVFFALAILPTLTFHVINARVLGVQPFLFSSYYDAYHLSMHYLCCLLLCTNSCTIL